MKKVLVTGANGFIGTNLLKLLNQKQIFTYAVIKDENEKVNTINDLPYVKIIYCSLEEINSLPQNIFDKDIDACIHLAWDGSFGEKRGDFVRQHNNIKYTIELIETLKKMNIKRFVGAGTLAEKDVLNYHLDDGATPNPVSLYGIAKLNTHLITKTICTKLEIEHIWCYLSNTYGVGNTTNNFVNMAAKKILAKERATFTAGNQTYDFVYISDTVRAIYYAASKGITNNSYYLGSGNPRLLKDYIHIIRDTIDPQYPIFLGEIPFNGKSLEKEEYSNSKLFKDTGFKAKVTFEEGITKTISWLKENYI